MKPSTQRVAFCYQKSVVMSLRGPLSRTAFLRLRIPPPYEILRSIHPTSVEIKTQTKTPHVFWVRCNTTWSQTWSLHKVVSSLILANISTHLNRVCTICMCLLQLWLVWRLQRPLLFAIYTGVESTVFNCIPYIRKWWKSLVAPLAVLTSEITLLNGVEIWILCCF